MSDVKYKEGSLEAPIRHPIAWQETDYYDRDSLNVEMERVYDICHGCRRCVNLCNAFPTLFDLIDASPTMEVDGVAKTDYGKVTEQCYLCDMCYSTKCPYVPPHEWNVDFPHLMLRAKAIDYKAGKPKLRDKILASTDVVGRLAGIPVVAQVVNAANRNPMVRRVMDKVVGIHPQATLPEFHSRDLFKRMAQRDKREITVEATDKTRGKVALFITCYGNKNDPQLNDDLISIFEHNSIAVRLTEQEKCCGMPMLELGDLEAVQKAKEVNVPELARLIDEGWDIISAIPSCVLMFKQELPLMFPNDHSVRKVQQNIFDPFEYLMLRHKAGKLNTSFKSQLGKVVYHAACHQRVQNIGLKTRDLIQLVPETTVKVIERCTGHDGTYAVKSEFYDVSMKICRPVVKAIEQADVDHYVSDCPMAGQQIANGLQGEMKPKSAFGLLKLAYGI